MEDGSAPIAADFVVRTQELREGIRAYAFGPGGTRALILLLLIAAAVVGLGQLLLPFTGGAWLAMLVAALVTAGLAALKGAPGSLRAFRAESVWKRQGRVSLDAERVRIQNGDSFSETAWRGLTGWLETERTVVLLDRDGVWCVLPKRAFADAALPRVRELLGALIQTPARPAERSAGRRRSSRMVWFLLIAAFFAAYAWWLGAT